MAFTSPWCRKLGPAVHHHSSLSSPTLQEVDWEVELAVIIGKKGKHIKVRWKGAPGRGGATAPTLPLLVLTTPVAPALTLGRLWLALVLVCDNGFEILRSRDCHL